MIILLVFVVGIVVQSYEKKLTDARIFCLCRKSDLSLQGNFYRNPPFVKLFAK